MPHINKDTFEALRHDQRMLWRSVHHLTNVTEVARRILDTIGHEDMTVAQAEVYHMADSLISQSERFINEVLNKEEK